MGDACEMLIAAEVTLAGNPAVIMPDNWPEYDILAQPKSAAPQRISVKSRTFQHGETAFVDYYGKDQFEWLAIVLLPGADQPKRRTFIVPRAVADARAPKRNTKAPDDIYWRLDKVAGVFPDFENNYCLSMNGLATTVVAPQVTAQEAKADKSSSIIVPGVLFTLLLLALPLQARDKRWDVPCQKVFVTGIQAHEIAWALKGDGLENNLYKKTCMQPVADASQADAILDIELDPKVAGTTEKRIRDRENAVATGNFWVSCSSDSRGSYCFDSTGYALETSCNASRCSTYYGPSVGVTAMQLIGDALSAWSEQKSAWAYVFSAKDHKVIWKYEGLGPWHDDLTKYSECPKSAATYGRTCKKPKKLLD